MNKLLHERLREFADSVGYKGCDHLASIAGSGCNELDTCTDCVNAVATAIADEIEKYYIPRPRFEDGEPVQFGDCIEAGVGTVECVSIETNQYDTWVKDGENGEWKTCISADRLAALSRVEPKVIDADGVEINVGDTVWIIGSGDKGVIEEISKERAYIKCYNGLTADVYVGNVSHREPDSLEKLRNDMREFVDTEYKIPGGTKTNEWLGRLTAIMERDA